MYRIYRKIMRRFARFVFGFERCPIDCKRDFRADFQKSLQSFAFGICAIASLLSMLVLLS